MTVSLAIVFIRCHVVFMVSGGGHSVNLFLYLILYFLYFLNFRSETPVLSLGGATLYSRLCVPVYYFV